MTMKTLLILHLLTLLALTIPTISCQAETENIKKQSSAELLTDPEFRPELGTYYYEVFWGNVRVGKATITIDQENDLYKVIVIAKTSSAVNLFYKARYRGEVEMKPYPLKPIKGTITEKSKKKKKEVKIRFPREDTVEAVATESNDDKNTTVTESEFTSETFILDPFSTVFLVRHLDWYVGMAEVFDIFTGKEQIELKLLCDSITSLKIAGKQRQAWVIIPETTSYKEDKRVTKSEFKVYLSRDAKKEILKIEGTPRIGQVVAKFRKFAPLPPTQHR